MKSTAVPSVPDVPDQLKEEQNFPVAKMKKFPDKDEPPQLYPGEGTKSNETATKHTNPKKRFVKAFEDLEMEEKKKSEKKEPENADNPSVQSEKRRSNSRNDTSNLTDVIDKCSLRDNTSNNLTDIIEKPGLKETPDSSSKENQNAKTDIESNTEKSEEAKGLEVLKLKSQLRTKLAESTEEKDQIIPKYKKFEMKRTPQKCTETSEQTGPSTRSVAEKAAKRPVEFEAQDKTSDAIVVDKQEQLGKTNTNDGCSSNSTSQDCLVRKKIEIIPKNHGEVNITLTKVVENNNAKGNVPFKKYLYSRRQGRYSVKYRSRLAYLDAPKPSTPDNIDQSSQDGKPLGNDKSIVSPVSVPTVEEIEFPKTSIQRTVNKQSLRQKCLSENTHKSEIPSIEEQESHTNIHEEAHQQKAKTDNVVLTSFDKEIDNLAYNEESSSHTKDDTDASKPVDFHIEQINDNEELVVENEGDKLIETTTNAVQEELSSNSIQRSKKKVSKSQKSSRQRRNTRKTKRDQDLDTYEEMDIQNADKLEFNESPLNQEESNITSGILIENITDDNKMNVDLQESLEEYVDIMTVTPKKKKTFGKPMSIIEPLKSDIIFADNSESVLESKRTTIEESVILDNTSTVNLNENLNAEIIEEKKDKVSVPENLSGTNITETASGVCNEIVISEKQTSSEQLPLQELEDKNEPSDLSEENLVGENMHGESKNSKIEAFNVDKPEKEDEIVNKVPLEIQEEVVAPPEPSIVNKDNELQPIIKPPSEDEVVKKTDEIVVSEEHSENLSEKPQKVLVETIEVSNDSKETLTEGQTGIKNEIEDIQSNTSTKKNDTESLTDLNGSERRSIEETDKVLASVFVTTPANEKEELSALSTLAAVSELSPPLEEQTSLEKIKAIEANLTVVSQTDLENVQVEIVNTPESKPVTLTNFSVDFTDGKQSEIIEKPKSKQCMESSNTEIPPEELPYVTKKSTSDMCRFTDADANDLEDKMTSLITSNKENSVQSKSITESDQAMTSSKLLEILTDNSKSITKSFAAPANENIAIPLSKTHITSSKDSKHIQEIKLSEPTISIKETKYVQETKAQEIRSTKSVVKSTVPERKPSVTKTPKPAIFTEKIMKPFSATETVSVQKVTSKRTNKDIEDIDTYIIQKPTKKLALDSDLPLQSTFSTATPVIKKTVSTPKGRGKAKILQQTIITPAGDVIQPTVAQTQQSEDSVFDINSMPIVLGDQILTPESIENMPVVISETAISVTPKIATEKVTVVKKSTPQVKTINKIPTITTSQPTIIRTYASAQKITKGQKNYQVASSKIIKSSPAIMSQPSKPGKFIIVSPNAASTSKTIAGKKQLAKQSVILPATSETLEPVGNKIMIVTNQQGQQQRVLLTPAQQKMIGYQSPNTKLTKAALKSGIMTKSSKSLPAIVSQHSGNIIAQTTINTKAQAIAGNQTFISSGGQVLIPITQAKQRISKSDVSKAGGKKIQMPAAKGRLQEALKSAGASKTIVIKNQQGQIVKKIQGTDDALLEQQVQEQVQAIKASSSFTALKTQNKIETISKTSKSPTKRSYPKKPGTSDILQKPLTATISATLHSDMPPPLTALSSSSTKIESCKVTHVEETKMEQPTFSTEEKPKEQSPLNELIIQDALGNQMTITEGQILALPSETVDGQTQSYMLVSLDKSGNLTPLNNEALLSLDPNLAIGGGDLSNIVLQVDDRGVVVAPAPASIPEGKEKSKTELLKPSIEEQVQKPVLPLSQVEQVPVAVTDTSSTLTLPSTVEAPAVPIGTEDNQTITCSVDTGNNQQLIISGDPISTQKFIESLTEGNTDLANLLAGTEGNILIHTDGQQILINTESENQLLLPVNTGNMAIESTEGGGNPIFATQSNKNQDILAAALADTDVFQQEQPTVQSKLSQSQLSPNSTLFPMNVGNVLETSLTLSSPIMTPLEVPSSNSKKIPDEESDILTTEVPKNVDLPITITDPNISQTVAQQQVATLMAAELQNNLDLPLTIADQGISVSSTEMNSPSYVYSLPNLDDSVEMNQKAFGNPISMPLLNEESELTITEKTDDSEKAIAVESQTETVINDKPKELEEEDNERVESNDDKRSHSPVSSSFMDGGLCTLGGAMCSSLSEPPPDMFDLSSNYLTVDDTKKNDVHIPENNSNSNDSQPNFSNDNVSPIVESIEDEERFRSNGIKRSNFLNENSVLRNRSPIANIDENSEEIPLQPLIVAHIPDKETQEVDCSSLESEKSEGSSVSLVTQHEGVPSCTENSSDTPLLNSESSILDSSKRKFDDELDLSTQKKPRVD
ncbi:uncharacterized protein LOC108740614 [Agrilus planipennis]|uniref:Uncharacterized protein LOC108740614 n=1 Tax=Agrilus planipennis TaxID=224129 RepID=A0A1W4X2Y5_AGRPL|nr:uncharacterized protein LOC108740614 [Agrilus planipennis]